MLCHCQTEPGRGRSRWRKPDRRIKPESAAKKKLCREDLLAEFAMTKSEITKNISTPTQPNHVKGAADGYRTSAAT
jgi:hypothetical protein